MEKTGPGELGLLAAKERVMARREAVSLHVRGI
jgi:hypothetical protein